jgi:RNA polymerase sigma-70 factor (ECF subfamily)
MDRRPNPEGMPRESGASGSHRRTDPVKAARPATDTDDLAALVEQAQQGDEDAFRAIYRAVQPGLLRYLRGIVGDEAEDVASEAWSQIARDLRGFRGDGPGFRGWAATIARNRALDLIRHQRRRPSSPSLSTEELADRPGVEDTAGAALDRVSTEDAIALIATLPRDQAEAVLLRVVMGLDVAGAARVLGKRSGAVRTAAHRGLRRLAERLGPDSAAHQGKPAAASTPARPIEEDADEQA